MDNRSLPLYEPVHPENGTTEMGGLQQCDRSAFLNEGKIPIVDDFDEKAAMLQHKNRFTYFPMRLGQELQRGRYLVQRNLGKGGSGSTWLAKDLKERRASQSYVSVKVLNTRATKRRRHAAEAVIMRQLRAGDPSDPGHQHVVHILDDFYEESVIGRHFCIVMPVMGRCLGATWMRSMSVQLVKRVTWQICQGVKYIHSMGILHGDLKLDNIMVELEEGFRLERFLVPNPTVFKRTIRFKCGEVQQRLPLFLQQPIDEHLAWPVHIRIGDYGTAQKISAPNVSDIQNDFHKAPEVLLRRRGKSENCLGITEKIDSWSIADMLFKMLVGDDIFRWSPEIQCSTEEFMLACMEKWLGPLPTELLEECELAAEYFSQGKLKKEIPVLLAGIRDRLARTKWETPSEELSQIWDLLRGLLALNPRVRFSAADALACEWFKSSGL